MLIEWGENGRRCTDCGRAIFDDECLDHICKNILAKAAKPNLSQAMKDYEQVGKHEVAAAQKKGGF